MSSARSRVFITETVQDAIPLVFFGGETPFKKKLITQVSLLYPEFVGVSDTKLSSHRDLQPYRVVWIMSGEEDWDGAVVYAKFSHSPLYIVVCGKDGERVASKISSTHSFVRSVLLSHFPNDEQYVSIIPQVLKEITSFHEKKEAHITVPQQRKDDEGVGGKGSETQSTWSVWVTEVEQQEEKYTGERTQHAPISYIKPSLPVKLHHAQKSPLQPLGVRIAPEAPMRVILERKKVLFSHLPTEKEIIRRGGESHQFQVESQKTEDNVKKTLERIFLFAPSLKVREKASGVHGNLEKNLGEKRKRTFTFSQRFVLGLGSFLLVFGVPLFAFFSLQSSFALHTKMVYTAFQNPQEGVSLTQLEGVSQSTRVFAWMVRTLASTTDLIGLSTPFEKYKQAIELSHKGVTAVSSLTKLRITFGRIYVASMQGGGEDPLELLILANTQVEQASKDLALFSSELANVPETIPLLENIHAKDIEQQVGSMRRALVKTQHLLGVLPNMLGGDKKKVYLVLIQNPLELRPSGGFLESFALVTMDKGRILDIQVQDVIQADNVLQGKVDPPKDLKEQLGEQQWFFRDSNWNTQFPLVAQQAEWFVQKELGRSVDGVVAINAYTLQDMLRVTGSIVLSGQQNEAISSDNVLERLFSKSESLFQGSAIGKKGFLSSVSEQIFSQIQHLALHKAEEMGRLLFVGLERGHILASVRDKQIQQTLVLLGATGAVMTPPCPQAFIDNSCVVDTIYQVDANVGVNRANYALTRYFEHRVVLSQNVAAHTYVMHYANTSTSTAWPSGSYKNYIRVVLPDFAQVNTILIDQVPLSPSRITQTLAYGKREVGFQIEVPVGKTVNVQMNYVTSFSQAKHFSYALFTQKQAGTGDDPVSYTMTTQKPLRVVKLAPEGAVLGNVVQFDTTLDRHQYLAVEVQ